MTIRDQEQAGQWAKKVVADYKAKQPKAKDAIDELENMASLVAFTDGVNKMCEFFLYGGIEKDVAKNVTN